MEKVITNQPVGNQMAPEEAEVTAALFDSEEEKKKMREDKMQPEDCCCYVAEEDDIYCCYFLCRCISDWCYPIGQCTENCFEGCANCCTNCCESSPNVVDVGVDTGTGCLECCGDGGCCEGCLGCLEVCGSCES